MAGAERDQLLRVAAELEVELGFEAVLAEPYVGLEGIARRNFAEMLSEEDMRLIEAITTALARVAAAASRAQLVGGDGPAAGAINGAIDGAEMVMWGELVHGNSAGRLASMLPGFVFLVVLPIVGREEALGISQQASELIQKAFGA